MRIKANVSPADVVHLAKDMYGLTVTDLKELSGFEDRNFLVTCEPLSSIDEKLTVQSSRHLTSEQYVMKISGLKDETCGSKLVKQRLIMDFLTEEQFVCPRFVKMKSGSWFDSYALSTGRVHVRMQTYVPGDTLMKHWEVVSARDTLTTLGGFVAKLHIALERLTLSGDVQIDVDPTSVWTLENFPRLTDMLIKIQDVTKKRMYTEVLERFQEEVMCQADSLSSGIIHGDLHDMNIIISIKNGRLYPIDQPENKQDSDWVKNAIGIIDFGDLTFSRYVFEVAMVIRDAIVDVKSMDPVETAGHFLGGYLKYRPLNSSEFDVLFVCILVGICQYGVIGEYECKLHPDNEYTKLCFFEEAWKKLTVLLKMDKTQVLKTWSNMFPSS